MKLTKRLQYVALKSIRLIDDSLLLDNNHEIPSLSVCLSLFPYRFDWNSSEASTKLFFFFFVIPFFILWISSYIRPHTAHREIREVRRLWISCHNCKWLISKLFVHHLYKHSLLSLPPSLQCNNSISNCLNLILICDMTRNDFFYVKVFFFAIWGIYVKDDWVFSFISL